MRPYRQDWTKPAQKDMQKLDKKTAERILDAVDTMAETGEGDIKKLQGMDGFRLRVGDWRVLFDSDDKAEEITILHVLHRREAYRN